MAEPLDSRVEEILQGGSPPLLSRIEKLLKEGGTGGGSVTPEQIAAAVEAYLDEHGVSVVCDSELSSTSEKPVQNKVITAALQEHGVFIAENGTTTNAEIYAAFQAGKVVICVHNDDVYYLSSCEANSARFVCPVKSTGYVLSFRVSNNAWYANTPTRFAKTNELSGYYTKPSDGIPASDLASAVQTSLGKADTALQSHQSLAAYRTASAQDTIDAAQDTAIAAKYTKPASNIPKSDLASDVQTSLGKADTALQAHQDISGKADASDLSALTARLNALADSDDTTLDQMSEIIAYIKSNKSLIDGITTGKVSVSDIVDNLTSNATNKPLSANQGRALKALIDAIIVPTKTSDLTNDSGYLTQHQDITGKLDKAQGVANAGKFLVVGSDGNVTTVAMTAWQGGSY